MPASSTYSQVFFLLIFISIIIFLTTIISLNISESYSFGDTLKTSLSNKEEKLIAFFKNQASYIKNEIEYFSQSHEKQTQSSSLLSLNEKDISVTTQSSNEEHYSDPIETVDPAHVQTRDPGPEKPSESNTPGLLLSSSQEPQCRVDFKKMQCAVSDMRFVQYWDDEMDCYVSPLRSINGLAAKRDDQKFIVFQPDQGGWNNIRMALEVVILLAMVTGRVLVMPPRAVLYLLVLNKKWKDNKSGVDTYFDFHKLQVKYGLETMPMKTFLEDIAKPGLLAHPLPNGDTDLIKAPLWQYLESACYVREWMPGKTFIGLNISMLHHAPSQSPSHYKPGGFESVDPERLDYFTFSKARSLVSYSDELHAHRAIYFPGHYKNRLLTHFYSYLFFADAKEDRKAKRFMRDRLRYPDQVFCTASYIISNIVGLEVPRPKQEAFAYPRYVAFHIRRGDFQQKQTRLPAETILQSSLSLIPDPLHRVVYIATDEKNRSFFRPFQQTFAKVVFLEDVQANSGLDKVDQNYIGMIEQVVCASADIFIGTPLSTFTAYITRMRGFMSRRIQMSPYYNNPQIEQEQPALKLHRVVSDRRGLYDRTYYYMPRFMHILHTKPNISFPLWVRDFMDVFRNIDD